jgi:hypothetical protein
MLDVLLIHVRDLLNQSMRNQYGTYENKVVVSNLLDNSASNYAELENRIVCFLFGIQQENSLKNTSGRSGSAAAGFLDKSTPLYLNLQLIFSANFKNKNYIEGLNYLSQIISFFHQNRVIFLSNIQGIPQKMDKVTFDMCNLGYDEMSQVWSAVGSKVLPSVIYKVGLVVFDDTPLRGIIPAIAQTDSESSL